MIVDSGACRQFRCDVRMRIVVLVVQECECPLMLDRFVSSVVM